MTKTHPHGHVFAPCGADLTIPSPVPLRGEERSRALRSRSRSLLEVCTDAGVRYRVTGGISPRIVYSGAEHHGYTIGPSGVPVYVVSTAGLPQRKQQRALRILEILAYGFQDYIARESVCGRGYFVYPITPDSGRLWLAEIGRRGGRVRSTPKAASSRRNGRSHRNPLRRAP